MYGTHENALHTLYVWPLALAAATLAGAGYFHSRALKLIDDDGPIEFIKNWKMRTEIAATVGLTWFVASLAGLTGASLLGIVSIALILGGIAPMITRAATSSYDEHRQVQLKNAKANR